MKVISHWLDEAIQKVTPNKDKAIRPRYLVIHYTAGRSTEGSIEWLCNPNARASAHAVIGRDGQITQLAPFNIKVWHAGISQWEKLIGLNNYSIGIELQNFGRLTKVGSQFLTWFQTVVPELEVMAARHKMESESSFWHAYTEAQIASIVELACLLVTEYRLVDILGHDDIAPDRKRDPGPAFPMDSLKSIVLGREIDVAEFYAVATEALNIRTGPGVQYPMAGPVLKKATRLVIVERQEDWSRVSIQDDEPRTGWVSNRYIHPA